MTPYEPHTCVCICMYCSLGRARGRNLKACMYIDVGYVTVHLITIFFVDFCYTDGLDCGLKPATLTKDFAACL